MIDGLMCRIDNDNIVITISKEVLRFAAEYHPKMEDDYGNRILEITDVNVFAEEVCRQLQDEEEDGTTLIHKMFDEAISVAVDNGCEGCQIVKKTKVRTQRDSRYDDFGYYGDEHHGDEELSPKSCCKKCGHIFYNCLCGHD